MKFIFNSIIGLIMAALTALATMWLTHIIAAF